MLNPQDRQLYLEALRPPAGYRLDSAVATTFSLDLLSLLMAPLSMIFSEQGGQEQLLKDPTAFLEAVSRVKDRLLVFCQAGRIAVPKVDTRLYSYLEPVVTEVQPSDSGVFHPKLWFLRFVTGEDSDRTVLYRLLCLSRNLTFDQSWDTLLSLEGYLVKERQFNYGLNRPLVEFIKSLPRPNSENGQALLDQMIQEIGRVQFEPPTGFDEIVAFHPMGISGFKRFKFPDTYNRLLVVSPFLTGGRTKQLLNQGQENILISRPDSLDSLSSAVLKQLQTNTTLCTLNEAAEQPEIEDAEIGLAMDDLSGLHAKLYIAESGWEATVLTGSANLSDAAFLGRNVEFMVELKGKRSQVGIQAMLGSDEPASLHSLLLPYLPGKGEETEAEQQQLETALDNARRAIVQANLHLVAIPAVAETFTLILEADGALDVGDQPITGRCYPISRHREQALDMAPLIAGEAVSYTNVSLVGLTSFVAFELTATQENQRATLSFVLNLPVTGIPAERDHVILRSIITDKNRFIRYLLFLLAEDKEFNLTQLLETNSKSQNKGISSGYLAGLPLLEELVRAASRQPEKIERIAAFVENLRHSEDQDAIWPEGFAEIWEAFLVHNETRKVNNEPSYNPKA